MFIKTAECILPVDPYEKSNTRERKKRKKTNVYKHGSTLVHKRSNFSDGVYKKPLYLLEPHTWLNRKL